MHTAHVNVYIFIYIIIKSTHETAMNTTSKQTVSAIVLPFAEYYINIITTITDLNAAAATSADVEPL